MNKVIWAEGICLAQQHFQHWEKYLLTEDQLRMKFFSSYWWGVETLVYDKELIDHGQFVLRQCRGIFKNGDVFDYQEGDDELSIELKEDDSNIYLAIAKNESTKGISGYPKKLKETKWIADYVEVQRI